MRSRPTLISCLIALLVAALIGPSIFASRFSSASALDDPSIVWDVPVGVKPTVKAKPGRVRVAERRNNIKKGVETNPLLTLKYQILKHDGDSEKNINPDAELLTGDQFKLAVTTNQRGFLYVIHRSVDRSGNIIDKPRMLFPDPRVTGGENIVTKNQVNRVPRDCEGLDDPEDCWWELTPPAGREIFNVIFSRDKITTLAAPGAELNAAQLASLEEIRAGSEKKLTKGRQAKTESGRILADGTFVQNPNRSDNEEIFETIELTHAAADAEEQLTPRAMVIKNRADGVRVTVLKDGSAIDSEQVFTADDELKVRLKSNFKGYVYFLNIEPGGKRCIIFPCSKSMRNEISPGVTTLLPRDPHVIGFDEKAGTEVFQVIVSREPVPFLDAAMANRDCCESECGCQLSGSAASAAAELAGVSKQQTSPFAVENLIAAIPRDSGIRSRGVKLASGRDQKKGEAFVAIDAKEGDTLKSGQVMVFEVRLKHQ